MCSHQTAFSFHPKENRRENMLDVHRCLEETEDIIYRQQEKSPVAAIITEPIQAEGGEKLCLKCYNQLMIIVTLLWHS